MPKKRHNNQYSKPPSVAPPSLSLSSSSRASEQNERSVNQILADLRRTAPRPTGVSQNNVAIATPTVHPSIRDILQIPEVPAPRPRRPQRRDANGRRIPPGPPPPRSWTSLSQSQPTFRDFKTDKKRQRQHWPLPGAYAPKPGSLVGEVLGRIVMDWDQQRHWNQFYFYTLPSHLRTALLGYILDFYEPGLSVADLRLVLTGPADSEFEEYDVEKPDLDLMNSDISCLDLSFSVGKSLKLKKLTEFLFPPDATIESHVQESWDTSEPVFGPTKLLPNLTQLSLAIEPGTWCAVSWKQLLTLANKLPTLTHLNLSGWPQPSLTGSIREPGSRTTVEDNNSYDWSEAIMVLKRLSKALYSLEYLDLTGCVNWAPALKAESDGEFVDWVRDWGKITMLRLRSSYALSDEHTDGNVFQFADWIDIATAVEKHIIAQRAGRGRWITVEKETLTESAKAVLEGPPPSYLSIRVH